MSQLLSTEVQCKGYDVVDLVQRKDQRLLKFVDAASLKLTTSELVVHGQSLTSGPGRKIIRIKGTLF